MAKLKGGLPIAWAMPQLTERRRMRLKVSVKACATVTTGLANDIEAADQQPALM